MELVTYLEVLGASEERQRVADMGICSMVNWAAPERPARSEESVAGGGM